MNEVIELDENKYFKILEQWAQRIKMGTICMNDDLIKEVVSEIKMFYWLTEGEELEEKIENFKLR